MFNIDLNKIPSKRAIVVIIVAFTIIIAPYAFLHHYHKHWFEKAKIIETLLISVYWIPFFDKHYAFHWKAKTSLQNKPDLFHQKQIPQENQTAIAV